ncbi:MAG: ABC transporter substrate-binding protein, partial [Ktedonobacteraceae bacterium]|nr:ABC transporter substrate-binding protein [Ktedonobacteraceae bacterium]
NDGSYTPWLATDYKWNSDNTQLTFTIRQGVKWNDDKPFDANDVVYTYKALQQYKAADIQGVWNYLKDVTNPDANTVVMTLQKAYPPAFYYIASQVYILPKHIYEPAGDPTKFTPDKPVGTGPFVLSKFSNELATYDKNPGFWKADQVKVDQIKFPAYKGNDAFKLALPKGDIDWAGFFQSDLDTAFVQKDPQHNHYWMAPVNMYALFVNQKDPQLSQLPVRQAINAAIDRDKIAKQAVSGLADPANVTGLILPNQKAYLDSNYSSLSNAANVAQAQKFLTDAGYTKGSDGVFVDKSGKKLAFKMRLVQGYTDWEQAAQIMQQTLKEVGIQITLDPFTEDAYYPARTDGKWQLMIGGMVGGPNPYYMYNSYLNSKQIGSTNFGQFSDPAVDQALEKFASTTDETVQKQAIQTIEKIYVEKLPILPLYNGPAWFEYRTTRFTGWPDKDNPYAVGSPFTAPDIEQVVLHLQPVQ